MIFSILFAIVFAVFLVLTIIASGIQSEINVAEERLSYVQEKIKELEMYEEQYKELELMGQVVEEAIGFNPGFADVIKEIGKAAPEEVVITKIIAKYEYDKERNEDGELLPGVARLSIDGALYGSPELLSHWADQIWKIDKIRDFQYNYGPSSEPDSLGRSYQNIKIKIILKNEPYRYFWGGLNE